MDSPIKRVGGKKLLRKKICGLIPEHRCYVEPFFGAGWVYFHKDPSPLEVINDIDDNVVNFFQVVQHKCDELLEALAYNLFSRTMFNHYRNLKPTTDVEKAAKFWYVLHFSFGGKMDSYGYRADGKNANQQRLLERINAAHQRLAQTNIECKDFDDIIQRYDRSHTFFYLDPPYFTKTGYQHPFGEDEHLLLARLLKDIQGRFLLSVNNCPQARSVYKGFEFEEVTVNWSIGTHNMAKTLNKELIVRNW